MPKTIYIHVGKTCYRASEEALFDGMAKCSCDDIVARENPSITTDRYRLTTFANTFSAPALSYRGSICVLNFSMNELPPFPMLPQTQAESPHFDGT